MIYKKIFLCILYSYCTASHASQGDTTRTIVHTANPHSDNIPTLFISQPTQQHSSIRPAICTATTVCGCALCCCFPGGMIANIPQCLEITRIATLISCAAFAHKPDARSVIVKTHTSSNEDFIKD